jgi:TetR/AcrR family transcriptional repressor of nem operon
LEKAKNPINTLAGIVGPLVEAGRSPPRLPVEYPQEMSPLDEGFRTRAAKLSRDWHDAIAAALREGQKRGVVRRDVDTDETATFLVAAYEGDISLTVAARGKRPVAAAGWPRLGGRFLGSVTCILVRITPETP